MSLYLSTEYVPVNCGPADSGGCGLIFAMTLEFYDETLRTGREWFCPNGHRRFWAGKTTEQKLQAAQARNQHLADQLRAATRDAESSRVALVRDRQRFANGVCPCCNRSFENVRRHMETQHPSYDVTKVKGGMNRVTCSCGSSFETLRGLRTHQGKQRPTTWDDPTTPRWRAHLTKV